MTNERIDRAFAVRDALADAWPTTPQGVSVSSLVTALMSASFSLSPKEWQSIRNDAKLNASWQYLRRAATIAELPRLAAASDSAQRSRHFSEGTVAIVPSRKQGLVLIKIVWTPPQRLPRFLLLDGGVDAIATRALGRRRSSGDFVIACDESNSEDQAYLRLLGDPRTTGSFLL